MTRKSIYRGRIVDLGLEDVVLPNGAPVSLEIIRHPGASAIVPLHDDGSVTLIHQYRHAAGGMIWEVPAGVLERDEAPETCARRELAEEVQLDARTFTSLGTILTTPGFTDERIHLFLAEGLSVADSAPEADEYIEVERVPFEQALDWIDDGTIADGKTICALHAVARRIATRKS
jgi:ADP-ribose pyrophosphatase